MKRNALIVPAVLGVLCLATSAWAGGASCSGTSEGASKVGAQCTHGASTASKTEAHCTMGSKDASATGSHCPMGASMASKGQCTFGANTAVFSFAVPTAHCGACANKIQSAAMAQKGVMCAKVDLGAKVAYVAGDKNLDQRAITKAIKDAGYTCSLKDQGAKARAEFTRVMAASTPSPAAPKKNKV
jgi:copper chaperone CopZ